MYSLLIVDDEEIVRRGLAETLDWESLGFRVAGTAKNGIEALDILEKDGADVVLADIRMPHLSGLELAERIRVHHPDTRVVILSGYDDFEYARTAIEQDVFSYLLKPLREERAAEVFTRLKNSLDGERSDIEDRKRGRKARLSELFRGILETGNAGEDFQSISERPFPGGAVMMLDPSPDSGEAVLRERWHGFIPRFLEELESISGDIVTASLKGDRLALLLMSPMDEVSDSAERVFLEIRRRGREFGDMGFIAALGKPVEEVRNIAESGKDARLLLGHALYLGKNRLLRSSDIREEKILRLPDWRIEAEHFINIMSSRDESSLIGRTDNIFSLMRDACPRDASPLKTWFRNFFYEIDRVLRERGYAPEAILGDIDGLIDTLSRSGTIGDMRDLFYNRALIGLEVTSRVSDSSVHRVVKQTIRTLQKRFAEDIGLETIADELGVSAPYLSRLFKSEMGVNFKEYLTRIRLDKARESLRTTGNRIYEIASSVGYPDQKYFCEIFKKRTGMTPREYRKDVRTPE
jgi:two-component system response regulator YesN